MVQREQDTPSGIHGTAEAAVLQDGQPVGEDGYVLGMFTQIFLPGVAHQCPAGDIFHAGKNGEEMTAHIECLLSLFSIIPDILPLSKRKNKTAGGLNRLQTMPAGSQRRRTEAVCRERGSAGSGRREGRGTCSPGNCGMVRPRLPGGLSEGRRPRKGGRSGISGNRAPSPCFLITPML